jgi:beta-lactamase class A
VEAQKAQILDPKTAIEALVAALNEVRLEEAAKRTASDQAVAALAQGIIEATSRQHEALLATLAAMSRDLVKSSIDDHLKQFSGAMANSVSRGRTLRRYRCH